MAVTAIGRRIRCCGLAVFHGRLLLVNIASVVILVYLCLYQWDVGYNKKETAYLLTTEQERHIQSILNGSRSFQEFYKKVENARKEIANLHGNVPKSNHNFVLRSLESKYFEKFASAVPDAKTVHLRASRRDVGDFLRTTVFLPTANNCSVMERSATGIQKELFMNRTGCSEDIKEREVNVTGRDMTDLSSTNQRASLEPNSSDYILSYIHLIPNAVVNNEGDVVVAKTKLITRHCNTRTWMEIYIKIMSTLFTSHPVYDEVFSIAQAWGKAFYHSTMEELPKLSLYLTYLQNNPHIKIHANMKHAFLPLLGLDAKRFISGTIGAKLLYQPVGSACGNLSFVGGQLLSRTLRYGSTKARNLLVLIRRSHARWFRHHDAIHAMLKKYAERAGLDVVVYNDNPLPGVQSTAETFRRAVVVIAPHGAGQSNMLFSEPGTVLIEGLCYANNQKTNLCYLTASKVLGLRYHAIVFDRKQCMDITAEDVQIPLIQYLRLLGYNLR